MINHYATTNDYYEYNQVIDSITVSRLIVTSLTEQLNQGEHYDYEPSWAGIQNGEGNDDEAWFVVMSKLNRSSPQGRLVIVIRLTWQVSPGMIPSERMLLALIGSETPRKRTI
jgi:hypothetical protein